MTGEQENQELILNGIGGSPGICIGKAYLVDREGVNVVKKYPIADTALNSEKQRFELAVNKAKQELHAIIENTPEEFREHANILETHVVLLKDKMLYGETVTLIENEQVNAEWALKKVVARLKRIFRKMADPYFRDRAADVVHVSEYIMRNLMGAERENIRDINKRVILVAHDLSPAETSQIQLERIKGFVTDRGARSSHTGIIARTLEIPAVVGLFNATHHIKNDDLIVVDGTAGIVILNPTEATLVKYEEKSARFDQYRAMLARSSHLPAKTKDESFVCVMGNIELPEEVVSVKNYGGDGIGLYRTEFQYMNRSAFPSEDELFEKYREVADIMHPDPVTIRTLDVNGDKAVSYLSVSNESNPALGMRAIRYCLKRPRVFKTQLRAILRASAAGNVRIMFPMISNCHEILEAKRLTRQCMEELDKAGEPFNPRIQMGIMVEVPSAVIMADIMAREVDFFSIGTNDLIQYSLAIDRDNQQVSYLYQPLHPAILRMVKRVADEAANAGIKVFMCGEMAADPWYIPILLGLGINELSMNPQSIPAVKKTIRSLAVADTRDFISEIMLLTDAKEIETVVRDTYGKYLSDEFTGQQPARLPPFPLPPESKGASHG